MFWVVVVANIEHSQRMFGRQMSPANGASLQQRVSTACGMRTLQRSSHFALPLYMQTCVVKIWVDCLLEDFVASRQVKIGCASVLRVLQPDALNKRQAGQNFWGAACDDYKMLGVFTQSDVVSEFGGLGFLL